MCKGQHKIASIQEEILEAIDEAFIAMAKKDYISYILFIGRADMIPGLKQHVGTDCVIDYHLDTIYDQTRAQFYLRYLRRNYNKDGFAYKGESGIDDMHIELMIYSHLWDSSDFIKSLMRIASIVSDGGYIWQHNIDWQHKDKFMEKWIITLLKAVGLKIGDLVEKYYDPSLRNAFAHSLYDIDAERRSITVRPQKGMKTLTFDEFQSYFLHSVILMNKMENAIAFNHDEAAKLNTAITESFLTPDGVRVQVFGKMVQRGKDIFPELRMAKIKEE